MPIIFWLGTANRPHSAHRGWNLAFHPGLPFSSFEDALFPGAVDHAEALPIVYVTFAVNVYVIVPGRTPPVGESCAIRMFEP